MEKLKTKFTEIKTKYEIYTPAFFFVVGFLFDIVTLGRVDDMFGILQQAAYLILIGVILMFRSLEYAGIFHPTLKLAKIWHYNNEAMHFLFGSLLSMYTLFFFLSSSFFTSFGFMIFLFAILLANELPMFQKQGPWLKFALYSVCLISYFSYIVPILLGFIGITPLLISIVLSLLVIWLMTTIFLKKGLPKNSVYKTVFLPPAAVGAMFLVLYFLKFLPPIPLSIQYIGIYHTVQKVDNEYVLGYEREWWRFWQKGAQNFLAVPGDKINCFVRIFSPTGFKDKVVFHWLRKNTKGEWESQDRIENSIVGGRAEGFRGYAAKSNYETGKWRVQVETLDGREIGRIYFTVNTAATTENREFRIDKF